MGRNRLEAFSDGVVAILITILVLELKVPHGTDAAALRPLLPVFLAYVLSFVYLAIYWNNHHHMLHTVREVTGPILWSNLHLLFWLSLIPFATGWMGENGFAPLPTALYGAVLLMAAIAYWILQGRIVAAQGEGSLLRRAVGGDWKGKVSPILYAIAIVAAFRLREVSLAIYVAVALVWLIGRWRRHTVRDAPITPTVAFIISAHDEASIIVSRRNHHDASLADLKSPVRDCHQCLRDTPSAAHPVLVAGEPLERTLPAFRLSARHECAPSPTPCAATTSWRWSGRQPAWALPGGNACAGCSCRT